MRGRRVREEMKLAPYRALPSHDIGFSMFFPRLLVCVVRHTYRSGLWLLDLSPRGRHAKCIYPFSFIFVEYLCTHTSLYILACRLRGI